jgi:hypothetical protein
MSLFDRRNSIRLSEEETNYNAKLFRAAGIETAPDFTISDSAAPVYTPDYARLILKLQGVEAPEDDPQASPHNK